MNQNEIMEVLYSHLMVLDKENPMDDPFLSIATIFVLIIKMNWLLK